MPFVILHEALHLLGLGHCNSKNCVMGLFLENGELKYSLNSSKYYTDISLCVNCKRRLYEQKKS